MSLYSSLKFQPYLRFWTWLACQCYHFDVWEIISWEFRKDGRCGYDGMRLFSLSAYIHLVFDLPLTRLRTSFQSLVRIRRVPPFISVPRISHCPTQLLAHHPECPFSFRWIHTHIKRDWQELCHSRSSSYVQVSRRVAKEICDIAMRDVHTFWRTSTSWDV